jgi:hypothetical protein
VEKPNTGAALSSVVLNQRGNLVIPEKPCRARRCRVPPIPDRAIGAALE